MNFEILRLKEFMRWKDAVQKGGSNLSMKVDGIDGDGIKGREDYHKLLYMNLYLSQNLKKEVSDHATAAGTIDISYVQVIIDSQSTLITKIEEIGLGGTAIKTIEIATDKVINNVPTTVQIHTFNNCTIKDMENEGGSINNFVFAFDTFNREIIPHDSDRKKQGQHSYTFNTKSSTIV